MQKHILLVTYTIYEGDDTDLVQTLERADSYELDESAWLLYTEESVAYWYSKLEELVYEEDELMVLKVAIQDIGTHPTLKEDLENWLKTRLG